MNEQVVLVDKKNHIIGTADKDAVHAQDTPLHRGFSLFLFNSQKELLLTQRALAKQTFPGVWTNTVCGHPGPGEPAVLAAKRRLQQELGINQARIKTITKAGHYQYRFADQNGIVENEICPILVAWADAVPKPQKEEVAGWKWIDWQQFLKNIDSNPSQYSPWCVEEARILAKLGY